MWDPQITIEEVNDPVELERIRQHRERAQKNWDWVEAHQHELLPHGFGKFLAVAGQEAFLADTLEAALEWVRTNHPEDSGHIVEYLRPPNGPRIYSGRIC
jgi:adenosyl cobinamide kinase/adenosyl cobinamide phosphate guanylyltransferase